mmetsp:Transcript_1025/g.3120  ORF Transcript_1025/g.3120 Transcript_1025/m.3120 type:complete len:233 (-) Transcript_1025:318-1016(-)|eukprot:CAMPEP_0206137188 /NCGR_PEP_ID=MMETSP1473-20131121/2352_1 /ASSEMBLY_ACC=CAM_ASM_001109 /TAXON_ID=1461547 /ORGANISM="Stichococcus sp, Strain RCC1054" /LENGTH=232 /DNA_ID=CAMNT_0053530153 /DNA_START=120 /DNA_END=818 /DNA_ORIENTATION=+
MAAATAPAYSDKELSRAREPLPVKSGASTVSSGLDRAIERSIEREEDLCRGNGDQAKFPGLDFSGFQSWLKLRTKVVLNPRMSADIGLDVNAFEQKVRPVACFQYQLKADCPNGPMLRVTDKRAVIYKPWNLNFKDRVQCTLNTAVGINRKGRPDVDVNMGDLKPTWLAVGIAVVALSQCLPVGGSKTFGSYAINSPFKAVAKGEVRSSLQKNEGNATLRLGVGQLNAFVRF